MVLVICISFVILGKTDIRTVIAGLTGFAIGSKTWIIAKDMDNCQSLKETSFLAFGIRNHSNEPA